MSILKKIRDRERQLPPLENRVSENTSSTTDASSNHEEPRELALPLPPARPCPAPICTCPIATWITVYDRESPAPEFRCYGCDPPPSWSFVGARWLLVAADSGGWSWEHFPRFDPRSDPSGQHANPHSLAVLGGDGGGDVGDDGMGPAGSSGTAWHDREPTTITAADGSRITIFERTGWNDLLRLTVRHGFDEAWAMLQVRTDLKLPAVSSDRSLSRSPGRPPSRVELELAEL